MKNHSAPQRMKGSLSNPSPILILAAALVAAAFSGSAFGQPYTIQTFAGGHLPVNVPGLSANLGHVGGIAVDQSGGVLITLPEYQSVVRWDPATMGLTWTAGVGTGNPYLPSGAGPVSSTPLGGPSSVAIDPSGTVYIGDRDSKVRKISGGVITTVPGVTGPGVAVDSLGVLYVASGDTIQRVANGVVTTVAGRNESSGYTGDNGPAINALLSGAFSLTVDSAGNIYFADTYNNVIRRISPAGVITTVAGNGTSGYSGDHGPATSARLNTPLGVAVDSAGTVYIADTNNNVVRKVSDGIITTMAGGGGLHPNVPPSSSCAVFPGGSVPASTVYSVSGPDESGNRVLLTNLPPPVVQSLPLPSFPDQLYCGPIPLANGYTVPLYVPTAAEWMGDFSGFNGIIIDPYSNYAFAGNVLPSGFLSTTHAWRIPPVNPGDDGPPTSALLDRPFAVAVDPAGNLYIADKDNGRVRRISNGTITTIAGNGSCCFTGNGGPATDSWFNRPKGIAADSEGNLYIADAGGYVPTNIYPTLFLSNVPDRIRKVSSGVLSTVASFHEYGVVSGVAVDSAGDLYITDVNTAGSSLIRKISNGVTTIVGAGGSGFAVDSAGAVFVADGCNYRVLKIVNGVTTTVAGNGTPGFSGDNGPATGAQLGCIESIAVDSAGSLYISDTFNRVRKVFHGVITTVAGNGTSGFAGDNGPATRSEISANVIATDAAGNLYIAGGSRIRKVSGGVITTVAGNGTAGISGDDGLAVNAQIGDPNGLVIGANGRVYFTDDFINRVRVLTPSGPACSFSATPTSVSPPVSGASIAIAVQSSCSWVVDGLPDWITCAGDAVSTGSTSVELTVAANNGGPRSAVISVAGVSILISQPARPDAAWISAVVNAASGLSGAIAPGEIVVLYGSGLGPAQFATAAAGPNGLFGTQLAGTSVAFNGIAAPVIYTSSGQLATVVPYEITGSAVQVTVSYQERTSAGFAAPVTAATPGIFTIGNGESQAAALNQDGSPNSASNPAHPGDVITLFATGEGQTTPPGINGKTGATPLPHPILQTQVFMGWDIEDSDPVELRYAGGVAGQIAGLMQINAIVPSDIHGDAVPILLITGNAPSQPGVTIAIK